VFNRKQRQRQTRLGQATGTYGSLIKDAGLEGIEERLVLLEGSRENQEIRKAQTKL
jgi:hypothetical protein